MYPYRPPSSSLCLFENHPAHHSQMMDPGPTFWTLLHAVGWDQALTTKRVETQCQTPCCSDVPCKPTPSGWSNAAEVPDRVSGQMKHYGSAHAGPHLLLYKVQQGRSAHVAWRHACRGSGHGGWEVGLVDGQDRRSPVSVAQPRVLL